MIRGISIAGASAIALGVLLDCAEARTEFFNVGGHRYSYDTKDPRQVAAARRLIEASEAAKAAKAKADAELAANPLVKTFGSQAQREAAETQALVDQIIAENERATADMRRQRAEAGRQDKAAGSERASTPTKAATKVQPASPTDRQARRASPSRSAKGLSKIARAPNSQKASQPVVRSVSLDHASGIKTTIMTDGSIHEEPIENSALSNAPKGPDATGSTGSVKRLP